jgi:hypothetical protein
MISLSIFEHLKYIVYIQHCYMILKADKIHCLQQYYIHDPFKHLKYII